MGSYAGGSAVDHWSEVVEIEEEYQRQEPEFAVVYRRKKPDNPLKDAATINGRRLSCSNENRTRFGQMKCVSWNRSLSTRGRTSIAAAACVAYKPQLGKPKRKAKPPLPRGKVVQPPNYDKERAYFEEVDSFELLEESPSPKHFSTWVMGARSDSVVISHLSSVLKKWLTSRKFNHNCGPSGSLSRILETPELNKESTCNDCFEIYALTTPGKSSLQGSIGLQHAHNKFNSSFGVRDVIEKHISSKMQNREDLQSVLENDCEDIGIAVRKLSLASQPSLLDGQVWDPFLALLALCRQSTPTTLTDVLSTYCDPPESIVKVGEGTYGEAFRVGSTVCKIVPVDGDLLVNGEVQKKSEELHEEIVLSLTLNRLREQDDELYNACTTFIQTIDLRVCQGPYDAALIRAWEEWDNKHRSENDHPKELAENQCYVVFIQEHGGKDLESFALLNFDEARSLLAQVTFALAVAEAAFQFEHRDLHWGNILLSRGDSETLEFALEGKKICIKTFGLSVSIIDFTLSRINTGEDVLFLDLSSDPGLFEGPKGEKQFDTYRRMKEVTEDCWEGRWECL